MVNLWLNQTSSLLLFLLKFVSCGSSVSKLKDHLVLNSGHKMPLRGFGTSNLKAKPFEVKEAVYQALQTGYRYRVDQESRREGWTDARSAVGFCLGSGLFGSYNSD